MTADKRSAPGVRASLAFWLPAGVHAVLHSAPTAPVGQGVVLVPPFGWEDIASYRVRREWAESLALKGHPTIRLDLPGTGDSSGPRTGPLLEAWSEAVTNAAVALRAATGCGRVAAIGLGLGGVPAMLAAAPGGIDDLALWSVPTRGRAAARSLRAFAGLADAGELTGEDADRLWVAGYSLPNSVLTELEQVDLAVLAASTCWSGRRALLIGRDGADPDGALVNAFRAAGVAVTVSTGSGYDAMVEHPQTSTVGKSVVAKVLLWLDAGVDPTAAPSACAWPTAAAYEVGPGVRERFVDLRTPFGDLAAVVSEPAERRDLCLVLFNAAATRRIGPNGMWVRAARQACARGATVVRFDLPGVGDSAGPAGWTVDSAAFYQDKVLTQVRAALDGVAEQGLPTRFLLAGLCSGAYWSFVVGQDDPRVAGAVLLNPLALRWDAQAAGVVHKRELAKLLEVDTWRRIVTGQVGVHRAQAVLKTAALFATRLPAARKARRAQQAIAAAPAASYADPLERAFDRLRDKGTTLRVVWGREQPLHDDLADRGFLDQQARWPNLRFVQLGGPPGVNTSFAPPALQREVLRVFDETVADLLQ